jgi:hypothetical protein
MERILASSPGSANANCRGLRSHVYLTRCIARHSRVDELYGMMGVPASPTRGPRLPVENAQPRNPMWLFNEVYADAYLWPICEQTAENTSRCCLQVVPRLESHKACTNWKCRCCFTVHEVPVLQILRHNHLSTHASESSFHRGCWVSIWLSEPRSLTRLYRFYSPEQAFAQCMLLVR